MALFFNNFLPSNIGGDVIRIRDTARPAGSMTLATAVVLVDRGLGLMGLVLVAACGASLAAGGATRGALPIVPAWLWAGFLLGAGLSAPAVLAPAGFGRMLQPLRVIHPEWIDNRIEKITGVLSRFRDRPAALAGCFGGAVFVQAATVVFYAAVAYALHIAIGPWDLAVIVPLVVRDPDGAGVHQRLRRSRSGVHALFFTPQAADRVGAARLARAHGARHALLAVRRGRLRRPAAVGNLA